MTLPGEEPRAEEYAALRRVATLVAGGAAPEDVFATVTEEVGRLLPVDFADLSRYESDDTITMLATWGILQVHARRMTVEHRYGSRAGRLP